MKRLAFAAAVAIAFAADAAWERAGSLQLTDSAGIMSAVAKLGEITGNQMIGAMAASQLPQLPGGDFFGPMRQGASLTLPFLAEGDDFEFAVIYPMALPKDEFVKLHPGAVETNGLLRVNGSPLSAKDEWDDDDFYYVAFSEDGRWAVASEKPDQVGAALAAVAEAARPMDGDLVRVSVLQNGLAALARQAAEADKDKCCGTNAASCRMSAEDAAKGFSSVDFAVRIGDAGLDFTGACRPVAGTEWAKIGEVALGGDALAFAGSTAVVAVSDAALEQPNAAAQWAEIAGACAKRGLDVSTFAKFTADEANLVTIDLPALVARAGEAKTNAFDCAALFGDLCDLRMAASSAGIKAASAPNNVAGAFAGFTPKFSVSQRFAATLPEMSGRRLFYASAGSVSSVLRVIAPVVVETLPEGARANVQPIMALLPQECAGGVAAAGWRDGESLRFMVRFSSDELKGVGACASAAVAFAMMNNGCKPSSAKPCAGDGDDDDEEAGDGDDD